MNNSHVLADGCQNDFAVKMTDFSKKNEKKTPKDRYSLNTDRFTDEKCLKTACLPSCYC